MLTLKNIFVTYFQETCEITVNYTIEVWPCANNIQLYIKTSRKSAKASNEMEHGEQESLDLQQRMLA
jgi:hypothetical protein